jgi:hypothetical protein
VQGAQRGMVPVVAGGMRRACKPFGRTRAEAASLARMPD